MDDLDYNDIYLPVLFFMVLRSYKHPYTYFVPMNILSKINRNGFTYEVTYQSVHLENECGKTEVAQEQAVKNHIWPL